MKKLFLSLAACSMLVAASAAMAMAEAPKDKMGEKHKARAEKHLAKVDTDKDGKISKAEFVKESEGRFARLDADGDGFVTREEMKAAHEKMRKKMHDRMKKDGKHGKRGDGKDCTPPPMGDE